MATEKPMQKKHNRGGARPGAGRPAFVPTADERKKVETLSGYGLPIDQIAVLVRDGISVDTLRAHFEAELKSGKAKANGQIAQTLFQKAMSGDTTAAIWWTKSQMRWSERHEVTGADGGPIKTENSTTVVLEPAEAYKRLLGGSGG
ncbi:MAG TPA: hypothetical protein VLH79_15540 [Chthonomonadales bacterium]|nr:hypothetical protein [Chthonomonadales bacterium]